MINKKARLAGLCHVVVEHTPRGVGSDRRAGA